MNVSRALITLGSLGLAEQIDDPSNRRRKPYCLSRKGWERHSAMGSELDDVATFLFGKLRPSERTALARIFAKLDTRLNEWQPRELRRHVPRA